MDTPWTPTPVWGWPKAGGGGALSGWGEVGKREIRGTYLIKKTLFITYKLKSQLFPGISGYTLSLHRGHFLTQLSFQ